MKRTLLAVLTVFCGIRARAGTNEVPTFTISAQDVVHYSVQRYAFPLATNHFIIKFQYTQEASNRVRAFTEAHYNQKVREKIGEFETLTLVGSTNTSGREGFHGISAKDADAIMRALKRQ